MSAREVPAPVAERLTELEAFCLRTGRRPSWTSTQAQELSLAQWVHRLRKRRSYRPFLDAVIHPYPVRDPERLAQVRAFCAAQGRLPAKRHSPPEEERLARWISEAKYRVDPDPQLLALLEQYPTRAQAQTCVQS